MKLSKSILQAVAFGVAFSTAASSCDLIEPCEPSTAPTEEPMIDDGSEPKARPTNTATSPTDCGGNETDPGPYYPCPACGMG